MIKYVEVSINEINRIIPMWKELIKYLKTHSNIHKDEFFQKEFHERITPYIKKTLNGKTRLIIAMDENKDIGYCLSSITKDNVGEVDSIYLNKDYRKLGIGDYFMEDALEFFDQNQTKEDILSVSEGNEDVMNFYRKYGFQLRYYVLKRKR